MCGEKFFVSHAGSCITGSPPHVRGKVPGICKDLERVGITPACAGKSLTDKGLFILLQDHPRMCGEKSSPVGLSVIA